MKMVDRTRIVTFRPSATRRRNQARRNRLMRQWKRRCEKCEGPGAKKHSCPYYETVHGDYKTHCNCCPSCTGYCADFI